MMSSKVSSEHQSFHSLSGATVTLGEIVAQTQKYVVANPEASYEIVIGSDSEASLSGKAFFVTAIVVRRIGNGGIYFWTRHEEKFFNLKDRIWKEAMLSITLAQELRSMMKDTLGEEVFWEKKVEFRCIHIDVGESGPTKDLIDGICGMVKGFGFEPVIKPYAYGAFVVADKHT